MSAGNAQLGFAIRAVNEASKALKEVSGDLDHTGKAAADADPKLNKAGQETKQLGDAAEHAHGPLGRFGGALGDMAKIAGGFVIAQGLMQLPGFLTDAAKGAAEDEAATARLNATLQNLVDRGAGAGLSLSDLQKNMDKAIDEGQKLAFADDQVRDSMGFMLNATDNYGDALKRHRAAMDLARGANIDLGLATKMLGKMTDENVNTFKKLGIEMKSGATEADALAAVQARFGGQAEQYAKSTAGQFEQLKIRMDEVKETIGYVLLPIMTKLGDVLIEKVVPMIEKLAAMVGPLATAGWDKISGPLSVIAGLAFDGLTTLAGLAWGAMQDAWGVIGPALDKAKNYSWEALTDLASVGWTAMKDAWAIIQPLLEKAAGYTWGALMDLANASWDAMEKALSAAVAQLEKIPAGKLKDEATDTSNWAAAWQKVRDTIQPAVEYLQPAIQRFMDDMRKNASAVRDALAGLGGAFKDLWESIKPLEPVLIPLAKLLGATVVVAIEALVAATRIIINLYTGQLILAIKAATLVIEGIAKALDFVTLAVTEWAPAIGHAFLGVWETVKANVSEIVDEIKSIPGKVGDIGGAIVSGIWDGILAKKDWIIGKLAEFASWIPDWIKEALGIRSPSAVMRDQVGVPIGEGILVGIASMAPQIMATAAGVAKSAVDAASAAVNAFSGFAAAPRLALPGDSIPMLRGPSGLPVVDWAADITKGWAGSAVGGFNAAQLAGAGRPGGLNIPELGSLPGYVVANSPFLSSLSGVPDYAIRNSPYLSGILPSGTRAGTTININGPVYGVDDLMYTIDRAAKQAGLAGLS